MDMVNLLFVFTQKTCINWTFETKSIFKCHELSSFFQITVQEIGYITDITINTHICTDVLSECLLVNKNHGKSVCIVKENILFKASTIPLIYLSSKLRFFTYHFCLNSVRHIVGALEIKQKIEARFNTGKKITAQVGTPSGQAHALGGQRRGTRSTALISQAIPIWKQRSRMSTVVSLQNAETRMFVSKCRGNRKVIL